MTIHTIGPLNGYPGSAVGGEYQIAVVNSSSSTIAAIAAVSGMILRVYKVVLTITAASALTFEDGTNALSGAMIFAANGQLILPNDGTPWFKASAGNALNIANSNSVAVNGTLYYTTNNA